jgi:hypothetical protein
MQIASPEDERLLNEAFGWLMRCAFQAAGGKTDYVIDVGTAYMLGGSRTAELLRLCVAAGLLTETKTPQGFKAWLLVQDPEFVHLRLKAEVDWENQQRNDTRDPHLIVPVRRRDGDNCRWCGVLVQWNGRRSNRTGTYDHLRPGEAGSVDTMVVACIRCNSGRRDNIELWDDNHQLRQPPKNPRYGAASVAFLGKNGWDVEQNVRSDGAPVEAGAEAVREDIAARTATPAEERPAPDLADTPVASAVEPAPPPDGGKSSSEVDETNSARVGSGMDGSGSGSGSQRDGVTPASGAPSGGRRRRRRGKRGRGKKGEQTGGVPDQETQGPPSWAIDENEGGAQHDDDV